MNTQFIETIPVLPSLAIERDVKWYEEKLGFQAIYYDKMYAVLKRENVHLHLQWHADTPDDPLLGGSVVRIVIRDIHPLFEEMVARGTVGSQSLRLKTDWNTNEFGCYDLNKNAIFFVEDIQTA